LNINNMILQIISRDHNFDLHHRTGETWRAIVKCPSNLGLRLLVAGITPPLSIRIFTGQISDAHQMRTNDNCLILWTQIGDIGKTVLKTIHHFWPRKTDRQFCADANFGELKQLLSDPIQIECLPSKNCCLLKTTSEIFSACSGINPSSPVSVASYN
jgi:hypothetical protein